MGKSDIQAIVDNYNKLHNTSFGNLTNRYSLYPQKGEYGFVEHEWPNIGSTDIFRGSTEVKLS